MKFLTFAFVINFVLVCWPKLDIMSHIVITYVPGQKPIEF